MFLVARTVPVKALTIPLFFLMRDFGQFNTLGAPILPHIAFQSTLPMALLVFYGDDDSVLIFLVLVQRRLVSVLGGAVKD